MVIFLPDIAILIMMVTMSRVYFYKQYKLHVSSTRVIVECPGGVVRTYCFTARMRGETKESVIKFLKRLKVV